MVSQGTQPLKAELEGAGLQLRGGFLEKPQEYMFGGAWPLKGDQFTQSVVTHETN